MPQLLIEAMHVALEVLHDLIHSHSQTPFMEGYVAGAAAALGL